MDTENIVSKPNPIERLGPNRPGRPPGSPGGSIRNSAWFHRQAMKELHKLMISDLSSITMDVFEKKIAVATALGKVACAGKPEAKKQIKTNAPMIKSLD